MWRHSGAYLYSRTQRGSEGSRRCRGCRPSAPKVLPGIGFAFRAGSEGVINAACGSSPLWWHTPPLSPCSGGTMGAGQWRQFESLATMERKPYNRPVGVEMHPFCRLRRRLSTGKRLTKFSVAFRLPTNFVRLPPRRGRFALRTAFVLISISRHNAAKTSPSGGSTAVGGDRGAFPAGAARLYGFPFRGAEL